MVEEQTGDPELLRQFLAGDQAAFARLYDRHDRACFDFIRRMLASADTAAAEDLHQEVWLAVARSGASFDAAQSRFGTWLFTIARNKVMDHFRRASTAPRLAESLDEDLQGEWPDGPEISPEHIAHNRQLGAALLREVQALPQAQRETFVLFAQQELSLEEVARVCGVGLETAKSRLRYARGTLRQQLAHWMTKHA